MDKNLLIKDSEDRMKKTLVALEKDFTKLRTGRASSALIEDLKVDYYNTPTPIQQLASITIPDSRNITIQPWDKNAFNLIEKAILKSDLGLTPINDGKVIRISLPPLTEDRRKELVKVAHKYKEDTKIAIRNIRRDVNEHLKKLEKDKTLSEDELKRAIDEVQKMTDLYNNKAEEYCQHKEKEILEIS